MTAKFDLLAVDVDGTLLDSTGRLSARNVQALRAAAGQGVRVVLATHRPPRATRALADRLGLTAGGGRAAKNDPRLTINHSGATVWSLRADAAIEHWTLPSAVSRSVIAATRSVEPEAIVSIEHLERWYTERLDSTLAPEFASAMQPDYVGPLSSFLHIPPSRLTIAAAPDRLRDIRRLLLDEYVKPGHAACSATSAHILQVVAPGVDKAAALARVADRLGVTRDRVAAIGDGPNDVGMLRWAGLGLAVANAWGEARLASDETLDADCDHHAVAEAIERWIL